MSRYIVNDVYMFKRFHPRFLTPALAGDISNNFFASERFERREAHSHGWGDRKRTRRGDMKFILLGLLSERPQHGYEIIKELETRRGGFHRLSPGSVYPTLQMLEESNYLTSEQVEGKRVYTITELGRQLLSERNQQPNSENPCDSIKASKPSELIELRDTLTQVNDAVTTVAKSGNLEQANQVRDLLNHVKREIYKILAQ
ncbi:PadR-like family transcriptional regulator [Calothrix sp. NIES-4071]|nr:PadR-like family transcriptional regulator [Calothrix sp. NIES-4071]BAZ55492.1 PadR-like family transcriptional regulator [Calothrix sp. NIES-4105]